MTSMLHRFPDPDGASAAPRSAPARLLELGGGDALAENYVGVEPEPLSASG